MRTFLLVMAVGLLTIGAVGCGSDDDDQAANSATTTTTGTTDAGSETTGTSTADDEVETTTDDKAKAKTNADDSKPAAGSGEADESDTPSSPATPPAEQPNDSGGGSADEKAASATAVTFLKALGTGQGAKACSLLTSDVKSQIEKGLGQAPALKGKDCAAILASVSANYPPQVRDGIAAIRVLNVRLKNGAAIVAYRAGSLPRSTVPLVRDGNDWRVGGLAGTPSGSQ